MNQCAPCFYLLIIVACIALCEVVRPPILPGSDWSTPSEPPGRAWDCSRSVNILTLALKGNEGD